MSRWLFLCLIAACALTPWSASAQETTCYTPATTTIAVLPVVDQSGEKEEQKRDQIKAAQTELVSQLRERGFQLIPEATVSKAISDLKINFDDEEELRRETFYKVGRAVKADLVIFVTITDAQNKTKTGFFANEREGLVKTKSWLLDVKKETPLFSAKVKEGKSGGGAGVFSAGGRGRQAAAAGNSVRDLLNETLKDYPKANQKNKK